MLINSRGWSRISGKGVHVYKGVGVRFVDFTSIFLNIPWKWNNLVSLRPNYFIFTGYLIGWVGQKGEIQANPLWIPNWILMNWINKEACEYYQELQQSHCTDDLCHRKEETQKDSKKKVKQSYLSLPQQDDCICRKVTKNYTTIYPDKDFISVKLLFFSCQSIYTCVLGAQKNRLIETVLLSTNNICFGRETKKIVFQYALLSGGLHHKTKIQHNSPLDGNNKMSKQLCVTAIVTGGVGWGAEIFYWPNPRPTFCCFYSKIIV